MSYDLMFQKAVELQQNGALNEAEQLYRQILQTAPNNANVLNMLGLIAQTKGLHAEAVNLFYQAIDSAPRHFPLFFNLAVSLAALDRYVEATEAYEKVLALQADVKEAYAGLGGIYWRQNQLEKATAAYRQALKIDAAYLPARTALAEIENDTATLQQLAAANNPDAAYYLGRRALQNGDSAAAVKHLSAADTLLDSPEVKLLLGQALEAAGQPEAARQTFYQAHNLAPTNDAVLTHLADLEAARHDYAAAEELYKKAIAANPQNLAAHTNFANLLCAKHRTVEALEEYRQAVLIAPQTPELRYNLALILKSLEEYEQALDLMFAAFYSAPEHDDWALNIAETLVLFNAQAPQKARQIAANWLEKMPEHLVAKHLWAALNGQTATNESAYNKLLFDTFAPTYEQTLHNLEYAVVRQMAELYGPLTGTVLDLGCGTGLAAATLKTAANTFIGVDIAPQMLALAAAKNLYTELVEDDIIHFLQTRQATLPATIIAADVFCYFGDLAPIFRLCAPHKLIFSLETDDSITTFALQANGRYRHNPQHITALLQQSDYSKITSTPLTLRRENGSDVNGLLFCAEK